MYSDSQCGPLVVHQEFLVVHREFHKSSIKCSWQFNLYCIINYLRPHMCNIVLTSCLWGVSIAKWATGQLFFFQKRWSMDQERLRTASLVLLVPSCFLYCCKQQSSKQCEISTLLDVSILACMSMYTASDITRLAGCLFHNQMRHEFVGCSA